MSFRLTGCLLCLPERGFETAGRTVDSEIPVSVGNPLARSGEESSRAEPIAVISLSSLQ